MSDYIDGKLAEFIAEYDGTEIDVNGMYGAQSPDLVQAYISRLLGREWIFPYGYAPHLWADYRGAMPAAGFERIGRDAPLLRGDVLVFDTIFDTGPVGICDRPGIFGSVIMFTQNPGPAGMVNIKIDGGSNRLLGAWRFTYGAECIALAGTYADKQLTRRDHRVIESMKANEWAAGLKPIGDPSMQPGDVVIFGFDYPHEGDPVARYGHVEISKGDDLRTRARKWISRTFTRATRK